MSKGNRMRATFSQQGEEIKGTISLQGDGLFMLECLGLLVGTTPDDVVRDLYSLIAGKVKP